MALVLAVLGIYGVMAFSTRQRARETAIRLALGATRWDVIRLRVREGGLLVAAGAALGLGAAVPLTQLMCSLLVGVSPGDPLTMSAAVAVLSAAAMLACYLPARRASRTNPLRALRGD